MAQITYRPISTVLLNGGNTLICMMNRVNSLPCEEGQKKLANAGRTVPKTDVKTDPKNSERKENRPPPAPIQPTMPKVSQSANLCNNTEDDLPCLEADLTEFLELNVPNDPMWSGLVQDDWLTDLPDVMNVCE
jgi:hypothetical protein